MRLSCTTQALLDQAHKPERQHSCHALVFYSNFPPLCVRPANHRSGAGLRAWSSVADCLLFFFFLIYRGKKCPCVGSFDPRSFIWCGGFYWPWNAHFPFHRKFMKWEYASCYTLAWKSTGEKNKTSSKLAQSSNDIWPGGEMLIPTDFPLIKSSKILIILINDIIILIFIFLRQMNVWHPK